MILTAIQQAKKNIDRVNLFLDGRYWTSLDKNQLLDFKLFKDKSISIEEKNLIETASTEGKVLHKVIQYIHRRPRSEKEIRAYLLYKKEVEQLTAQNVIEKLKLLDYISDQKFAEWYIEQRMNFGIHGINKIKAELIKKGITKKIIDETLNKFSLGENFEQEQIEKAQKYLEKHLKEKDKKDKFTLKAAVYRKLTAKGFDSSIIEQTIKRIENPESRGRNNK